METIEIKLYVTLYKKKKTLVSHFTIRSSDFYAILISNENEIMKSHIRISDIGRIRNLTHSHGKYDTLAYCQPTDHSNITHNKYYYYYHYHFITLQFYELFFTFRLYFFFYYYYYFPFIPPVYKIRSNRRKL